MCVRGDNLCVSELVHVVCFFFLLFFLMCCYSHTWKQNLQKKIKYFFPGSRHLHCEDRGPVLHLSLLSADPAQRLRPRPGHLFQHRVHQVSQEDWLFHWWGSVLHTSFPYIPIVVSVHAVFFEIYLILKQNILPYIPVYTYMCQII